MSHSLPLPDPIPNPTLCDLPLPLRLSLLGQPAVIALLCEMQTRLARLEHLLDLPPLASGTTAPPPAETRTAAPTMPAQESPPNAPGLRERAATGQAGKI